MHIWSFWAKYCHFWHILSNARPKNNVNKVPRWVVRYVGNKTFDFCQEKIGFFAQNWHFGQFGPGHAGLFGALLVGRLVVVVCGLYLARHLFTLYYDNKDPIQTDSGSGCLKSWRTLHVSSCLVRTSPEFCPVFTFSHELLFHRDDILLM